MSINSQTALVAGASRGIGLALTRHLLSHSDVKKVYASYRQENTAEGLLAINDRRLKTVKVDIADTDSLMALSEELQVRRHKPDLVINCAGILHEGELQPEKSLGQCREESLSRLFLVNSIGPLMLAKSVLPSMPRNRGCHFAVLSAMVGSIGDNRLGGWYGGGCIAGTCGASSLPNTPLQPPRRWLAQPAEWQPSGHCAQRPGPAGWPTENAAGRYDPAVPVIC
jgi:NAD(P)-dependent dehydrogenase (short-subunit alcohol dehydrogenase family)